MENEPEENISTVLKTVKSLSNDKKMFASINDEGSVISAGDNNTGIYNCDITNNGVKDSESFVDDDDNSCLTTRITTNELCDSNSIMSLSGVNISDSINAVEAKNEEIDRNDLKDKIEQSAFDIQPLTTNTGIEDLSSEKQIIGVNTNDPKIIAATSNIDDINEVNIATIKTSTNINDTMNVIVPTKNIDASIAVTTTSKSGRRSSTIHHEVGPRQLKYNQIGVYWKDKESRVYARFTWATRKYSKSFYVGPNKPYATVRDAEKAAIRFLLINSPLHRRSHLKHFRFTESDEEDDEPYVGSQALREARRTKSIMLHFPAPESDDEVWSHYNTSNVNPATLYGEIIKKMDGSENNIGLTSPIKSAIEYTTSKVKQLSSNGVQMQVENNGISDINTNKNKHSNTSSTKDNISSDDLFLALVAANQMESDRLVERNPTGAFTNQSTTTTVSTKKFKPCQKSETLDSSEINFFPSNQFTVVDQGVTQASNPLIGMDYNALVALQQAQMANYYLQQQVAYAAAVNMAIAPNNINTTGNVNPFMLSQYNCFNNTPNIDSNRSEESEVDNKAANCCTSFGNNNIGNSNSTSGTANGFKGTILNPYPIQIIAESTMDQYGGIIPGQETKAMPSSNVSLCNTAIPGNYTDYMTAMTAAAYTGWYAATPFGYTAMPLVGSYAAPIISSIVPNPNILGAHFQNSNNILTGNSINTMNMKNQVNGSTKLSPTDGSATTVANSISAESEMPNSNTEHEETSHSVQMS